jgi:hypothetical protein
MKTGLMLFLCAAVLAFAPRVRAQTTNCQWRLELAPDAVRSPVQMDIHAGYRIFVIKSDGTAGYTLHGRFPFAAFLSFTIYSAADGLLQAAVTDYQIEQDPGSINPFLEDQLVDAPNRSYTITVLPAGAIPVPSMPNPIFLPPPAHGSNMVTAVLVQRIYLPEPRVNDRFGGVDAPTIEPFEVSNPTVPAGCPTGDFSGITSQFGNLGGNFRQSPSPMNGKISFFRPPISQVPFADGSGPFSKHDCTGYLMATVLPDEIAVIRLPAVPRFFDNTNTTAETTFPGPSDVDARYVSVGSYGASVLRASDNENVAGPDLKRLADGSAVFVAVPIGWPDDLKQQVKAKADELGYNYLPLAREGPVIKPFLIYRQKVATSGFAGSIQNVACFRGTAFNHAPLGYAASPKNMGEYAPTGVECSSSAFLLGGCGQ